jgi:aspartate kinase
LLVKCFLDASLPGTIISSRHIKGLPPIIVVKADQVLVHLSSKDFSFVGEAGVADLYELFSGIRIKPNLLQTGAVSLQVCLDNRADKIERLALEAANLFDVQIEKGLSLLTIRHYDAEVLDRLTAGKAIVLRQQTAETVQVLMK